MLGQKSILGSKKICPMNNFVQEKLLDKKNVGPKIFGSKNADNKYFVPNISMLIHSIYQIIMALLA